MGAKLHLKSLLWLVPFYSSSVKKISVEVLVILCKVSFKMQKMLIFKGRSKISLTVAVLLHHQMLGVMRV